MISVSAALTSEAERADRIVVVQAAGWSRGRAPAEQVIIRQRGVRSSNHDPKSATRSRSRRDQLPPRPAQNVSSEALHQVRIGYIPAGRSRWRQVIMTDQTVLVSRDVEKRLPILNFEKRPLGHLLLHPFRAMALPLSGKVRFRTGAKRTVHKLP